MANVLYLPALLRRLAITSPPSSKLYTRKQSAFVMQKADFNTSFRTPVSCQFEMFDSYVEITFLAIKPGIQTTDPRFVPALQQVRRSLKTHFGDKGYRESRFFISATGTMFIFDHWDSLRSHHSCVDNDKKNEVLEPLKYLADSSDSVMITWNFWSRFNEDLPAGPQELVLKRFKVAPASVPSDSYDRNDSILRDAQVDWTWSEKGIVVREQFVEMEQVWYVLHKSSVAHSDVLKAYTDMLTRMANDTAWEPQMWKLKDMETSMAE